MSYFKSIALCLMVLLSIKGYAQDPEFSQYYAAPLYLNPAFTGTGSDHRFIVNYRNQWPSVMNGFVTHAFSYDYNLEDYNSGVGLLVLTDRAGSANLRSTLLAFNYSYKIIVNDKLVISPGLSFGYGWRNIDYNKLVFGDQLQFDSDGLVPTDDPNFGRLGSANYFDFGTGFLVYNKTFWFGFAATHLNRPNRSMIGEEAIIPVKSTLHGGVRIPLSKGPFYKDRVVSFSPSFVYKHQGEFDQLDLGFHFLYEPIMIGFWYRGIPIQQNVKDNLSQDAVVVNMALLFSDIEIGYSYDFTVSELGPVAGGAHEVAIKYRMKSNARSKTRKKEKFIPCPTFIKG